MGLRLRCELLGAAAVEQRVNALGAFGVPLQQVINAYAHGAGAGPACRYPR